MGFFGGILTILVFVFNFLLFLIALVLIYVVSFTDGLEVASYLPDGGSTYSVVTNVLLTLGIFIAVLAFLGCYGVATDKKLYLLVYATTLLILIAIQLYLAYNLYLKFGSIQDSDNNVGEKFKDVAGNQTQNEKNSAFLHQVQRKYNCCGLSDYKDWTVSLGYKFIPGSCCGKDDDTPCNESEVTGKPGCSTIIMERGTELLPKVIVFFVIVFGLEVVLAASTMCIVIINQK